MLEVMSYEHKVYFFAKIIIKGLSIVNNKSVDA